MAYSPPLDNEHFSSAYSDRSSMSMQGHHTHDDDLVHSPFSPPTPEPHQPLLNSPGYSPRSPFPLSRRQTNTSNPTNNPNFISSPLNPRAPFGMDTASSSRSGSTSHFDSQPLLNPGGSGSNRGSMILWKMAGDENDSNPLIPPNNKRFSHFSARSRSNASLMSYSEDSKYPQAGGNPRPLSGLIAYAYDPLMDHDNPDVEDEKPQKSRGCHCRGFINIGALVLLSTGIVALFMFFPIISFFESTTVRTLITGNVRINSSGQAPDL